MEENKFQREVLDRLIVLETLLKQYDHKSLAQKADDAYNLALQNKKEISEIKEKNTWFSRTILAAIIVAMVGIIFLYLKLGLGVK